MGEPKGLLDLDGVPLLRAHVERLREAGLPVTVVLGARAREHLAVLPSGVRVVLNPRWAETDMATSAGLALGEASVLLTPVDVPPARRDTLARLAACAGDAVPTWAGRDGHPVRLGAPHAPGRLDLRLARAERVPVEDPDCVLNLNTPEAWRAWRDGRLDVCPPGCP